VTYRVVHQGTGYAGVTCLKLLAQQPQLELVGQYVTTPGKVGKDPAEFYGGKPTGVKATNNLDEIFALKPDCLTYFADSVQRERESIEDLIPFLERGINCISISGWRLGHPKAMEPDLLEKIEAACRKGNSSVFYTCADPGWATSDLAIAALATANRVDEVRVLELGYFLNYTAEYASREYFGFGKPMGHIPELVTGGFIEEMWTPTILRIADALDVEIDEFVTVYETAPAAEDIQTGFGLVEKGTAAVVRFELQGRKQGRNVVVVEHVDRLTDNLIGPAKNWKVPFGPQHHGYQVEITGDPTFTIEMNFPSGGPFICMPVINAIPAVCEAPAGLLTPLQVPRYWTRNVTAKLGPWP
jgi:hypothetical protein